ncbi:echinoderm microtubule-associated protein-like 2 isoform X2 [Diorhabda sublineata]|uniref:echinoderm microtubule-associated protein-like 2 isoform X2 n=1 Tax=Diorhabda sublineata TaxID=1163346 RepID=UPI0024E1165F|nr:echinoderm microtubule-associated protein-like 2 isoform X2 [Diorhabda sublineata]XP_056638239.1 echinoderm microtubule-associated protein-like 2 isoform X2 [Diorhabda sublineata]
MQLRSNSMESPVENHELVENENHVHNDRISELERKVSEQQDELVCLKATLAEALRRLNNLELSHTGSRIPQSPSASSTPTRLNNVIKDDYSKQSYSTSKLDGPRKSFAGSSLPQRKQVHYRSTGSLHSDSHSSSSVSPIPSPSPRATPVPVNNTIKRPTTSASSRSSNSSSSLHKRWSSTGDFNQVHQNGMVSKYSTRSFLNISAKVNNHFPGHYKHGIKDITYNEEEKSLRFFLRGRPIVVYAPSDIGENYEITKVSTTPSRRLKLDWVYGYRGKDCRSNLYFLPTGEMVYFVAALVVLYNPEEQSQRHYAEHTDDVKSLAIHPNKMTIATGQCAGHNGMEKRPHIRVWHTVSLHTQAVIGLNDFELSVCCLSFGKADGSLLVAIDEAPDHTISVWDWQKGENGHKITETKCSVDTIVAAEFHPLDRNTIVTCGKSHIAFWSLDVNGTLYKRMGIFESRTKPKYVTCVNFLQSGDAITGDSNGNLAVWIRGTNTISKYVKRVHDGSVFTICVTKDGSFITGGGKDGKLVEFSPDLTPTGIVSQIEGHFGGIRMISEGRGRQILIGTTHNCILLGTFELGFQPIVLGHSDEVWALSPHPNIPQFATAGYDRVLQLWDSMSHTILWSKDIEEQAQSICYTRDGTCVVVGCIDGKWMVFDVQTRELLVQHTDGNEPIQVITFSPDGTSVAMGSRDSQIYIYQVSDDGTKYSRVGRCSGHSSSVTHLDWANNNQTLRSNSADYELLFWNAGTCRQIPQSSIMRDVEWATNTCTITFTTVGIWPENADGTDVNCCGKSHDAELLVTGDDFGKVKLYSYPTSQPRSLCHSYGGHSSHVTGVNFLYDDSRIISIGGNDTAVLQWTVS